MSKYRRKIEYVKEEPETSWSVLEQIARGGAQKVLKMALEAAGYDVSNVAPPRNVSARGSWANAYVSKAEELGLSLFNPDLDVHSASTRGEVVQIILEVLKLPIAKQTAQFF